MKSFPNQRGILSVLPSDPKSTATNPPSLRRTLSADMSSASWLSPKLHHQFNEQRLKQGNSDSWSSLLLPKPDLVPYVHPLVQKSTNYLTENSLSICTESLGSESGSDGFSSETGDFDGEITKTEYPETETFQWKPIKFRRIKSPPRSFPPPISTLTSPDGGSLSVQSRRENGRLILDAVSVPSRNNFHAERRDGRLILSILTTPASSNVQEEHKSEIDSEKAPRLSSSVMNFHRLAMMMKKPNGLINRNPTWTKEKEAPLSQSLPPRPPSLAAATAAGSLNSYEYYWRSKPIGIQNPIGKQHNQPMKSITQKLICSNNQMANEKQQILVLRGNRGDYLVPLSNGCKLPRRSLLLREPCCIATT